MVDTVDHHAGFAINTAMSEKFFSLIEKFKKGRDGRRPLSGSRSDLPAYRRMQVWITTYVIIRKKRKIMITLAPGENNCSFERFFWS